MKLVISLSHNINANSIIRKYFSIFSLFFKKYDVSNRILKFNFTYKMFCCYCHNLIKEMVEIYTCHLNILGLGFNPIIHPKLSCKGHQWSPHCYIEFLVLILFGLPPTFDSASLSPKHFSFTGFPVSTFSRLSLYFSSCHFPLLFPGFSFYVQDLALHTLLSSVYNYSLGNLLKFTVFWLFFFLMLLFCFVLNTI